MKECKKASNLSYCTCTYEPCSKKGLCCECIAYHNSRGELPGCVFPKDAERTYDRSVEAFIRACSKRG
jgi:hypothetical protein